MMPFRRRPLEVGFGVGEKNLELSLNLSFLPQNKNEKTKQVGAYPGLTRHFAAANLDPRSNQWRKVHDATPAEEREEEREGGEEGAGEGAEVKASFEVVESSPSWWEVPIEGEGSAAAPPDNPVPAADGALYSPPSAAASPAAAAAAAAVPAAAEAAAEAVPAFGSGLTPAPSAETMDPLAPLENGGGAAAAATAAAAAAANAPASTNSAAAQAARAARERLASQEDAERAARAEAQAKAAAFLSDFYAKRDAAAAARPKPTALHATPEGGGGPTGETPWERVLSLLDLESTAAAPGSARSSGAGGVSSAPPNAADLSRFKAAMFTAKAKGLGL